MRLGEKSPGLIFALTTPTKQVQWALFCFLEPAQKIFLKKCGNLAKKFGKEKVRRRKAFREPWKFHIHSSDTFLEPTAK